MDVNNRDRYLGIEGLDLIGTNNVQDNWKVINQRLDEEDSYQKDFNLTLLIVSSTSSKGARSLQRNYDTNRTELKELRDEIAKYGYDRSRIKEQRKEKWTAPLQSREDLVRELYRQMDGVKDKHDTFMDTWMSRKREEAAKAKVEVEKKQQEYRKKFEELDLSTVEGSRPVTTEELNNILDKRKQKKAQQYMTSMEDANMRERFIKKVSTRVIRPVDLRKK